MVYIIKIEKKKKIGLSQRQPTLHFKLIISNSETPNYFS